MQKSPSLSYRPDVSAPYSPAEIQAAGDMDTVASAAYTLDTRYTGASIAPSSRHSQASDTSDSDQECEPAKSFLRRISTNRTIRNSVSYTI